MVRASRWPRGVIPLLVVSMLSLSFIVQVDIADGADPSSVEPVSNRGDLDTYPPIVLTFFANFVGPDYLNAFFPSEDQTGYEPYSDFACQGTYGVEIDDLNNDGFMDLVCGNLYKNGNLVDSQIFWGDGIYSWSTSNVTTLDTVSTHWITTGDFNGDGWSDIASQGYSTSGDQSLVFLNNGDGTFDFQPDVTFYNVESWPVVAGDLNKDGYDEVLFGANSKVCCYFGGPDGPDNTADITLTGFNSLYDVNVHDIDLDGHLDVLLASRNDNKTSVFLGGPNGPDNNIDYQFTTSSTVRKCDAGDINGDGFIEIVYLIYDELHIFEGTSTGWNDSRRHDVDLLGQGYGLEVLDIDGDGFDDIVAGTSNKVYLLFGGSSLPSSPRIQMATRTGDVHDLAVYPTDMEINATLPTEPQNLSVTTGDRYTHLSWDPPETSGGVRLARYTVYRGLTENNLSIHRQVEWNSRALLDYPKEMGITYYYAVSASNFKGESNLSNVVNITAIGSPLEPIDLEGTAFCESVLLEWGPPMDAGGLPILGYKLYRGSSLIDIEQIAVLELVTNYYDTGLENGKQYLYRLLAFNSMGDGPLSKSVYATPVGPPSSPRYMTAFAFDSAVELEWRAPVSDGGKSLIGYRVLRGLSSDTLETIITIEDFKTSYSDTGLTNGEIYFYTVKAFNEIGESPLSSIVNATPIGLPGMPKGLGIVASDGQVTLTWEPPETDGGTPLQLYQVFRGTSESQMFSFIYTTAETTSYTDKDLKNGHPLFYAVCAVNVVGDGPHTEILMATPLALPDAPGDLIAEAGDRLVTITWTRPVRDGGSEVTQYIIYRGTSEDSLDRIDIVAKSRFIYTDEDLVAGMPYYYAVAASTLAGEGPLSIVASVTPYGPPGAPTDLVAAPGDSEVRLTWSAPDDNGASTIDGYVIQRGTSAENLEELTQLGPVTSYVDTSVTNGQTYYYTVAAINEAGAGDQTDPVSATPFKPATVPDKVTILVVEAKNGNVVVSWTEPQKDGGSPITGYVVLRGEAPGDLEPLATLGPVFTWTDEDVERGATYYYSVAAINDVGEGEPFFAREVKVPKEKKEEGPGFEVFAVVAALMVLVPIVRRRWMR